MAFEFGLEGRVGFDRWRQLAGRTCQREESAQEAPRRESQSLGAPKIAAG